MVERQTSSSHLCSSCSMDSISNLEKDLRGFLRSWYTTALAHHVPCHPPSLKTIFVKHSSVVDLLCNHKQAIDDWGNNLEPTCTCASWRSYQSACFDPTAEHWVLQGHSFGDLLPAELQVIAEGSLQNKVFPSKKEFSSTMRQGLKQWCKDNGLPSFNRDDVSSLIDRLLATTLRRTQSPHQEDNHQLVAFDVSGSCLPL